MIQQTDWLAMAQADLAQEKAELGKHVMDFAVGERARALKFLAERCGPKRQSVSFDQLAAEAPEGVSAPALYWVALKRGVVFTDRVRGMLVTTSTE